MGLLYHVFTLAPEVIEWVRSEGVAFEEGPSRHPSPAEVRDAVEAIPGFSVRFEAFSIGTGWSAFVEEIDGVGKWALLHYTESTSGARWPVSFEKGWPEVIVAIVERLTRTCGTLVLFCDGGSVPLVIGPGIDPALAIAPWMGPVKL